MIKIVKSHDGQYYAVVKGNNHEILSNTETMTRKANVIKNIFAQAVQFKTRKLEFEDHTNRNYSKKDQYFWKYVYRINRHVGKGQKHTRLIKQRMKVK